MALIDNLVAYYQLDSAGVTADAHGAYTLTNSNAVSTTTGKINEAATFASVSSQQLSATITELSSAAAATINFWGKRTLNSQRLGAGTAGSNTRRFGLERHSDNVDYVVCGNATNSYGSVAGNVTAGDWAMHTLVFDGGGVGNANRLKYYVNGAQRTLSFTGTIAATIPANGLQGPLVIGAAVHGFSEGQIDEFGVWNRALSGAEITELYNGGAGLAYPFSFDGSGLLKTNAAYFAGKL